MGEIKPPRSAPFEFPPTVWPLQFGRHGISIEEELTSSGNIVGQKETIPLVSKAVKRRAKDQDGGDDKNETITKDSERSVRRRENAHEGYGNNSFDYTPLEEPEKITDTQERAHLENNMKEIPTLRIRSSTVESQDSDMGSFSEQLDMGSQAMDKSDTSDLRTEIKMRADEVNSWEEYHSPEYNPSSEVENHNPWLAPDSPCTKQRRIENTRKSHLARARHALDYYHTKHPGYNYTPVHVNLKHVIFMVDTRGYYIHMNFTARNTKDGAEEIFFAELCLSYEGQGDEWVVTACDMVGLESLGGLRRVWRPNGISFVGDAMDVQNCYACDDFIKHIEGAMYEAGHRGPAAYEVTDISEE